MIRVGSQNHPKKSGYLTHLGPEDVVWWVLGNTAKNSLVAQIGDEYISLPGADGQLVNGLYHEVNPLNPELNPICYCWHY